MPFYVRGSGPARFILKGRLRYEKKRYHPEDWHCFARRNVWRCPSAARADRGRPGKVCGLIGKQYLQDWEETL